MLKRIIDLECSRNRQNVINISATIINMVITILLGFVLSPYIVRTIGVEANGFVALANNFISYATLAKTALNSMGSRFIMMAYYKEEHEKVRQYYSSLFFGDMFLGLAMAVVGGICVWKLELILDIPPEIVGDVKLLFGLLFTNAVISTVITAWGVVPYVKNKLYLDSINSAAFSVIRALMIIGLFMSLSPSVCFLGIGTVVAGAVTHIIQFFYKITLFSNLKARVKDFSWTAVKVLVSSGIWNTVSSVGILLASGLDLLIANMFIGATDMGILALVKTIPGVIDNLNVAVANVFTPSLIMDYAQNKIEDMVETIRQSAKIISVLCSLPFVFLLVYGREFFALWQPTENADILYVLSVITVFSRIFFTGMQPLFNIFMVVNKVKQNSCVLLLHGFVSIGITFLLLKTTNLGVYAIAGVSVVCMIFKNVVFVIPYSAKYLGLKKRTFFYTIGYSVLPCAVLYLLGSVERILIRGNTWETLFMAGILFAAAGFGVTSVIILNRNERRYLFNMIKRKR